MKPTLSDPFAHIPVDLSVMTWTYTGRSDRWTQLPRKDFGTDHAAARAHVARELTLSGTGKVHICATGYRGPQSWPEVRVDAFPDGTVTKPRKRNTASTKTTRFPDSGALDAALELLDAA